MLRKQILGSVMVTLSAAMALAGNAQSAPQNAAADLAGKTWQLVKFEGSDDTTLTPDDRSKYTIAFERNGSVSARIDCNRGRGTWKSSGPSQLEFGPLAITRAQCPPGSLHDQLVKQWPFVRSYVIKDGHLFLSLMADGGIYEFEPMTAQPETAAVIRGVATYRERMALPPDAVFEVTLEDVSKADAPSQVITRMRVEGPGNPPFQFAFTYDSSRINPRSSYGLRARILAGEKLLFTTDRHYPVLTAGAANEVNLLLRRLNSPTSAGAGVAADVGTVGNKASLENIDWQLMQLGGAPVIVPTNREGPYFALDSKTHRVAGSGGCNRFTGSYQLNGDRLAFSQMASTMMACLQGMETEQGFLDALKTVTKWKIAGASLELFDYSGKLIARFNRRETK